MSDQDKQGSGYNENQADYGSPRGGDEGAGMSKEEWLRQNPDGAFDPDEAPGEGMTKEEWLRQNPNGAVDPDQAPGEGMSKEEYLRQTQLDARDDSRH